MDSLYTGDTAAALTATYYNANGSPGSGGNQRWTSSDSTVVKVNQATGVLVAVAPGNAVLSVSQSGVTGAALVVVTDTLGVTLLQPQIEMLPQDTFIPPISIRIRTGVAPAAWFTASPNGYFTIDSATGRIVTTGTGAPSPYQVNLGPLSDAGTIEVVSMGDTTGGASAYTVNGSVSAKRSATVRATNYSRTGGTLTFLLTFKVAVGNVTTEIVNILSQTAVTSLDSLSIDSVSVSEAQNNSFLCSPPRSAAAWSSTSQGTPILAVSRAGGYVKIRKLISVTGGSAISGSFFFLGQRADYYTHPSGLLAIQGNFVAPLITTTTTCH
ncbi:MAG TPA: hypothetical protein VH113_04185 [Gemmatimonadales bacterium]|nr:hypothetical protein [Gemmatimonadales bacterium]